MGSIGGTFLPGNNFDLVLQIDDPVDRSGKDELSGILPFFQEAVGVGDRSPIFIQKTVVEVAKYRVGGAKIPDIDRRVHRSLNLGVDHRGQKMEDRRSEDPDLSMKVGEVAKTMAA